MSKKIRFTETVLRDGQQSLIATRMPTSDMLPIIKKHRYPVTIFVYPSAISNAKYAMTWDKLRSLKKTGLFDIQSHS